MHNRPQEYFHTNKYVPNYPLNYLKLFSIGKLSEYISIFTNFRDQIFTMEFQNDWYCWNGTLAWKGSDMT